MSWLWEFIDEDFETVKEFHWSVTTIVNQTRALGEDLKEQKVVKKLLKCLDPKFNLIVGTIEEVRELTKLSVKEFFINR